MTGLSLFLGCLIPNRYPGIEIATRLCLAKLNIDFVDLEGASCCPAPGVFRSFDEPTWLALASRNIVLSEKMQRDMLTICNGCFGSLSDANHKLKSDRDLRSETNVHLAKIGKEFRGNIEVRHIMEYLFKNEGVQNIRNAVERPLELRVAVHYGCHLLKPSKDRGLGDFERPRFFDELVEAVGATSIDYPDKMQCCGAGGGVRSALKEDSLKMTEHKLSNIRDSDVDCIVNACPFCHMQLDVGQKDINETTGEDYNIPVLHYTQLLGMAMGFSPQMLGVDMNATHNRDFIDKIESMQQEEEDISD